MRSLKFLVLILATTAGSTFFVHCNKATYPDPCETIDCKNGANCIDGVCVCPEGWTGKTCNEEITPTGMSLQSLSIERFSEFNSNGNPWDRDTTGPDIYFTLSEAVNSQLIERFKSMVQEDVTQSPVEYDLSSLNARIQNPGNPHAIILYDQDDTTTQSMGSVSFIPYQAGSSFRDTLVAESADKKTAVRMVFRYTFQ